MRHPKLLSMTRLTLLPLALTLAWALGGCSRGDGKPGPAAGASASAAASAPAAAAAAAASAPVLLLAAEDLRVVSASTLASGPVISGEVQPERRADLRAEVGALVKQVLKENGEQVRAGEVLVRLDDTAIRDALASADEAQRASGQSFEQAERQLQRLRTLQTQGMVSMQSLEDAEVRRNNAQSDLVAARARVSSARQQLQRTEVRAPFAGVLSDRKVSAGDTASVGKELVKVIDPASLRFEGLVSADRLHELKLGQAVSFRVNGYPQDVFVGSVKRIDASANAATRQVEVLVAFADPAKLPRVAGLFAEGRVETGGTQALMLPESAIKRAGEAAHVWRVEGQALRKVAVKLGERDSRSGEFPAISGLAAGDRILRNPGSTLVDGQRLELARASVAASAVAPSASTPR